MYKKLTLLALMLVFGMVIVVPVSAHTPMLYVEDYGDGTIFLEGGFSDGSSASGTEILLIENREFGGDTGIRDDYLQFIFSSDIFKELGGSYLEYSGKDDLQKEDFSNLVPELFEGKLIIFRGELDDFSTLNLPKPEGSYQVVFNAGPGHTVIKEGPVLTEEEKAFLE